MAALGDAQIGLAQSHAVLSGQAIEPLDRRMQKLGVGRERNGLGLHRGVHGDASKVVGPQRAGLVRNPQTLGQQQLQLVAEPVAPMAQVRALVREDMLEELRPGEVLEIGVVDPALAHLVIGQREDVFEQKQPDHEAGRCGGSALVAEQWRDLAVDPLPIDLASKLHQLVLEVDDLIEPRPEQIARTRRLMLLRPHGPLRCSHGIIVRRKRESPK